MHAGRLEDAVRLYQELTTADPGDETLWRSLFQVVAALGDRQRLKGEEQRMHRALQDVDPEARSGNTAGAVAEPSAETVRELQRLYASLDTAEPTSSVVA